MFRSEDGQLRTPHPILKTLSPKMSSCTSPAYLPPDAPENPKNVSEVRAFPNGIEFRHVERANPRISAVSKNLDAVVMRGRIHPIRQGRPAILCEDFHRRLIHKNLERYVSGILKRPFMPPRKLWIERHQSRVGAIDENALLQGIYPDQHTILSAL